MQLAYIHFFYHISTRRWTPSRVQLGFCDSLIFKTALNVPFNLILPEQQQHYQIDLCFLSFPAPSLTGTTYTYTGTSELLRPGKVMEPSLCFLCEIPDSSIIISEHVRPGCLYLRISVSTRTHISSQFYLGLYSLNQLF